MLDAFDEVANIARLPELPAELAGGGSQGLVVMACLQDLSQAGVRWDWAADGFLTLFTYKIVLPGSAAIGLFAPIVDPDTRPKVSSS